MTVVRKGDAIRHAQSGVRGVVDTDPRPARSAGGALMAYVVWQTPFGTSRGCEFVKRLVRDEAAA